MKEFAAVITIDIPVLLTAENKNDAECKAVKNNPFVLKNKKVFGRKKLLLACSSHTEVSEMTETNKCTSNLHGQGGKNGRNV